MKKNVILYMVGFMALLLPFSCNNEDEGLYQLKNNPVQSYMNASFKLTVTPNIPGWTYSSQNGNIASVTDSGVVTLHYVGTTMVYARYDSANYVDSVRVTVKPRNTLFRDPFLTFFCNEETVKRNEKGRLVDLNYEGKSGREYEIWFEYNQNTEPKQYSILYNFNTDGCYDYSSIGLDSSLFEATLSHLSERYLFQGKENRFSGNEWYKEWTFINPDSSVFVCLNEFERYQRIYYHPFP